ncbi:MAG: SDR family NAD(P)-dependent oxidoreductase [Acidimicrobiales bacterium]|nr:SDR family NAD(P)-dependent oxidoreductase [Acidimicrobiales bacterium]
MGEFSGGFDGRTAVVSGAASGIGLAITARLLGAGARVVMADVEPGALDEAAAGLAASGEVLPVVTDVRDPEAVERLAQQAADAFGVTHLVFANAGVSVSGAIWDTTPDDWQWIVGVNVLGVAHMVRSFVPRLLRAGQPGHVCLTASVAGYMNQPGFGAYNATKHAVVGIGETLAADLREAGHPIGVTVLAPWFVRTNLAQAARNRPSELPDAAAPTEYSRAVSAKLGAWSDTTQSPDEVAALALAAIETGWFAVFPYEPSRSAVRDRIDAILDGGIADFYLPE